MKVEERIRENGKCLQTDHSLKSNFLEVQQMYNPKILHPKFRLVRSHTL